MPKKICVGNRAHILTLFAFIFYPLPSPFPFPPKFINNMCLYQTILSFVRLSLSIRSFCSLPFSYHPSLSFRFWSPILHLSFRSEDVYVPMHRDVRRLAFTAGIQQPALKPPPCTSVILYWRLFAGAKHRYSVYLLPGKEKPFTWIISLLQEWRFKHFALEW
jgi:hypothetical protein